MSKLKKMEQGRPELPTGSAMVSEPPGPEVMGVTFGTGDLKTPKTKHVAKHVFESCGGDGKGSDGGGGGNVKKGRGLGWTNGERRVLWECYVRSGGEKRHGYIKRVKDLYDRRSLTPRTGPSLISQLKTIDGGGLTLMERGEIEKLVRQEGDDLAEDVRLVMAGMLDWIEINETFDDSREDEFLGFEDGDGADNDDGLLDVARKIDFEVEGADVGRVVDALIDDQVVAADVIDTWSGNDGAMRALTDQEKEVLKLLRDVQMKTTWDDVPSLRAVDRKRVRKEVEMVDGLMHNLVWDGMSVTDVNRLLYAGGVVVAQRLGLKVGSGKKTEMMKPWWQRRIEGNIKTWRKELAQVEEIGKGSVVRDKVRMDLERRYRVTERGVLAVSTFLKNKIQAGSTKIRWFVEKKVARRQNNLFRNNQSQLYKELGGNAYGRTNETPDATESREFWESIWAVETEHDGEASWLEGVRRQMDDVQAMEDVVVSLDDVKAGIRRMANWKAPGPDGVRGFWFKKLPSLHGVMVDVLQECVESGDVPAWMVKGRTVLIQKDPAKGKAVSNYRPIACLPLMWKLLTGIFAEKIYDHLQANNLLPDEQKGCRKRSRGTKDQLLIDKAVLKEARAKKRYLAMAWIDYRKAYDMLPHSWILESLGLIKVAKNIDGILRGSMKDWRTELTANGEALGEVMIRRGIFQGDSLSPLLFIVAMLPLTRLLKRENLGYRFGIGGTMINHLLFMDDVKLYAKDRRQLEELVKIVQGFSTDIGMEFGLDKCAVLVIRAGVKVECDGIELPDGQMIKEVDENGYKYLGVLEGAGIKTKEMKVNVRKEYLRRVKLVAGSKLYAGNLVCAVNVWAVSVVRYTAGILEWSDNELKAMDVKTRKILTMNGAFHMQSSVDRLYMKRRVGGRGLISVEQCVRSEEAGLCEYVMANDEWMLKVVAENMIDGEPKDEYKKRMEKGRHDRLMEKKLHGKFFNEVKDVADERSWQWLRGGFLDKRTEGYVCAAQEKVLNTRCFCRTVMKKDGAMMCRMCGRGAETVGHLTSACEVLAQREYKRRHDRMGLRVYWELCGKYGVKRSERWYDETPDEVRVSGDGNYEVWWDKLVITPTKLEHNRPDVVVIDRVTRRWTIVDFSVPFDANVVRKENQKVNNYGKLATEVSRMYKVSTIVIPIVVGSLGVVSKRLAGFVKRLGIGDVVGGLQMTALIGTAAILRKVLSSNI